MPQDPVPQSYHPVLSDKEYARTISALGVKKANTRTWQQLLLGFLAGLYIGVGSHLFLVAMAGNAGRLVAGAVFGVGLVLVVAVATAGTKFGMPGERNRQVLQVPGRSPLMAGVRSAERRDCQDGSSSDSGVSWMLPRGMVPRQS